MFHPFLGARGNSFLKGCQDTKCLPICNDIELRRTHAISEAKENCRLPKILDGSVRVIQPAWMVLDECLDDWMRPVHRVVCGKPDAAISAVLTFSTYPEASLKRGC